MKKKLILIISVLFLSLTACNEKTKKEIMLPNITGKPGEVVVVIENHLWKSTVGDSLKDILLQPCIGLPQEEALFSLVNIPSDNFGRLLKTNRNVIVTKIAYSVPETEIRLKKNVWAKPQTVLYISAPDTFAFIELIGRNKEKITNIFLTAEKDILTNNAKKFADINIADNLKSKHKIGLHIPKGYSLDVNKKDFVWLEKATTETTLGIFVYYYDYKDTVQFSKDFLIAKRDSILKVNVPGSDPGSYMTTEHDFPVYYNEFMNDNRYMVEMRGWWELEKGFMGGPFVSLSTVDQKNNRIVTVEGFVFAPKFEKRNYIRELEGIISTLWFPAEKGE